MTVINLHPFIRPNLDVLFVALNPPDQSNTNGHYFSGSGSRFFHLLCLSGLITKEVPKLTADEIVFGSTAVNFKGAEFGVIDLVDDLVETNSGRVRISLHHVNSLLNRIRNLKPRFVCIIHSKVRNALNKHAQFTGPLEYGICGRLLRDSSSSFILNYFPNGNSISDEPKLEIFRELLARL